MQGLGPWQRWTARTRSGDRTWACRGSSATSPAHRRRSSSTAWSSSVTPPSRATTRRASRTSRATSWLRRTDRQAPLEVPRHPAARRVRPRDVAERRVVVHRRRVVVGADVGRPRARHRLHPDQSADDRLLRRLPAGSEPVRNQRHRAGREDRQARLALPDGAQRSWNYDLPNVADRARPANAAGKPTPSRPDDQAGIHLHVQPRDRRSRCGRSKSGRSQTRTARELESPTQPFPTRPEPMETQGLTGRRPDRLHAGAARRGARDREEVPDRRRTTRRARRASVKAGVVTSGARRRANITNPADLRSHPTTRCSWPYRSCRAENMVPGAQIDSPATRPPDHDVTVGGATAAECEGPQSLPIFKPPYKAASSPTT